ncbi:hypothetical protein LEP1GSC013_3671 [Leptospira interrogans serovar Valbuzzi str. Duyster]|nr:hypothetical protein LEP1GSC013_3671 [Leptospira interrogans serovar Valbuzzi str. Duyster]ENO74159.1 hypothetical protein LEP1GSC012_1969 [Leptospira interrogans serovar Valbuzzi str. Valbuzzi]
MFFQHGTRIKKSILKSNQNKKLNFVKRLVNLQIVNYGYKVVRLNSVLFRNKNGN